MPYFILQVNKQLMKNLDLKGKPFKNRQVYNTIKEQLVNSRLKSYLEGIGGYEWDSTPYFGGVGEKKYYLDTLRVKCDKRDEESVIRMIEKISTFEYVGDDDFGDMVCIIFDENESNTFERFILNELGIDSSKFENGEALSKIVNALTA